MAVAHYQFEAIHPFHDGNGRTGRVINILMLIEAGLLHDPILYLSRAIIARKGDYYRLLRAVTDHAWIEWVLYMLEVVRESARSTTRKIGAIRACRRKLPSELAPLLLGDTWRVAGGVDLRGARRRQLRMVRARGPFLAENRQIYPLPANDDEFGFTYPVAAYDHNRDPGQRGDAGVAVAGGYVYRGDIPLLKGRYLFADLVRGHVYSTIAGEMNRESGRLAPIEHLKVVADGKETTFQELRVARGP
ncbi:Fic family protein [Georgenia sp. SUBG003]|uniref:Fic family protein n=1 Tax=Georgenia sp. SUBG003 TaxID=1497974 RepID=UPI003AB613A3